MEDNELVPVAMQIILHAGDARVLANEAIEHAKQAEFEEAKGCLAAAHQKIIQAHQSQTQVIQEETRGIQHEPSLLFTHAQDTMMTISSELRLTKVLVEMFELIIKK